MKQFQREIYEATGDARRLQQQRRVSQRHDRHRRRARQQGRARLRSQNPDTLKSVVHKVYFNEVAGKVKEILDAHGAPYANARSPSLRPPRSQRGSTCT